MARFTGSGSFTLSGTDARIYDMKLDNSGGVTLNQNTMMAHCNVSGDLTVGGSVMVSHIKANTVDLTANNALLDKCEIDALTITGDDNYCDVHVETASGTAVAIVGSQNTVVGSIDNAQEHGVTIVGDRNRINMMIDDCGGDADNTYDCVNISGASNRNMITNSMFIPRTAGNTTRSAVNIGGTGECNMVVGNDLGDPDDYGTDAIIDTAANTQLFWPADATYGDNYTDCGTGS